MENLAGSRWYRPLALGLTLLVLGMGLAVSVAQFRAFESRGLIGVDYGLFMDFGRDWLATGTMYRDWQLAGPYAIQNGAGTTDFESMPSIYPPIAAPVFAVWSFLPAGLWWAVPIAVLGYVLVRLRPAPWAWPVMACALLFTSTASVYAVGGSTLWVVAGIAGGLIWGWPALVVLLKPTFVLFAVVGMDRRSFWIGLALIAALSLLMLTEWIRWIQAMLNAEGAGLLYSIRDLPLVAVPVIAWLASERSGSGYVSRVSFRKISVIATRQS